MIEQFQLGEKQRYWVKLLHGSPIHAILKRPEQIYLSEEGYNDICNMRYERHMTFAAIAYYIKANPSKFFEQPR